MKKKVGIVIEEKIYKDFQCFCIRKDSNVSAEVEKFMKMRTTIEEKEGDDNEKRDNTD